MVAVLLMTAPSWLNESGVFRTVFDAGPSPTLLVNANVEILAINKAAEALFGPNSGASLMRHRR